MLAASTGFILNRFHWWNKDRQTDRIVKKEGGPLEQFLDAAMHQDKDVLLTLKCGKVYLGQIVSSFIPDQRDQTIILWPIWSGYRNPKDQTVTFTTNYEKVYTEMEGNDGHKALIKDFRLIIPIQEILSATLFSKEIHATYFKTTPPGGTF
jgi:hypothetical protein